ncbi:MAG: glycoside hydrolase family 130 protein [Chitinophagaceae bacterium]
MTIRNLLSVVGLLSFSFLHAQTLPSWSIGPFVRPEGKNPIINIDTVGFRDPMSQSWLRWKESDVFNPAAVLHKGKICILYRAEDNSATGIGKRTSRIGLAESKNGLDVTNMPSTPVVYPAEDNQKENEWPGGCEDPRVAVTDDGTYVMLYTQWNRKVPRLAVAHSSDLRHWTKYGPVFSKAYDGKFKDMPTKSASVVTTPAKGRLVITQVKGKYLMYWGERHVYMATSADLINWEPLVDDRGELVELISPRKGYFDSRLTECGPPAVLTKDGIVLMYNGKNAENDEDADKNYTLNSYCAGQVLFDKTNPTKVLARLDKPFLKPEAYFEKSGQYPAGTVFIEGLVLKNKKWFLYYGCADSKVAVATSDNKK